MGLVVGASLGVLDFDWCVRLKCLLSICEVGAEGNRTFHGAYCSWLGAAHCVHGCRLIRSDGTGSLWQPAGPVDSASMQPLCAQVATSSEGLSAVYAVLGRRRARILRVS